MKTKLLLLITLFESLIAISQPEIEWQKSLGGSGGDVARSVRQTLDGGYIVAGYTVSVNGDISENNGGRDIWVVKLNSAGTIEWDKSIGSMGDEEAYAIQQTIDGGYILIGMSDSDDFFGENIGDDDILIVKLDNTGNILWVKRYGTIGTDRGHSIKQTSDGGYIASGFRANGGIWVVKLNDNGDLDANWSNTTFGGAQAWWAEQTSDGGYIVTGHYGLTPDLKVIKLDPSSNVEWQYTYGGTNADYGRSVRQTLDGGYIVAGMTQSSDGDVTNNYGGQDYWILKLNSLGGLEWEKNYGGTQNDFAVEIQQTLDGGYVVTGQTNSDDNDVSGNPGSFVFDYWTIKIDDIGDLLWQNCLGGGSSDFGSSIHQTTEGGYIVAGRSSSNNYDVSGNHGDYDFWVVKLEAETLGIDYNFISNQIKVYPNPVSITLHISTKTHIESVKLYDILGMLVFESSAINQINVSDFKSGIYILKLQTSNSTTTRKIFIE